MLVMQWLVTMLILQYVLIIFIFIVVVICEALNTSSSGVGGLTLHFSAPATTVGTRAIYSCSNSSYQIIGNAERTCGVNGSWIGAEPHCGCKCRCFYLLYIV